MHEHVELAERLRRANPVADPSDPPVGAVGAGIVLLEIERRSTIVQTTDRTKPDTEQPGRRWSGAWIAAAAFAAVIIIVVGVVALAGGGDTDQPTATTEPTTTQAPTTTSAPTTTEVPTTTAPTTTAPTTTVAASDPFPGVPDLTIGRLDPGPVAVRSLPIPFSFQAPDMGADFTQPLWVVEPGMPGPGLSPGDSVFDDSVIGTIIFPMTRAADDVDQVLSDLTAEIPVAQNLETTVGGRPATQVEVADFAGGFPLEFLGVSGSGEPNFGISGEMFRNRFYVVDAPAGTLVIWFEIVRDEWDTLLPYWEEIVTSIEFAPDAP